MQVSDKYSVCEQAMNWLKHHDAEMMPQTPDYSIFFSDRESNLVNEPKPGENGEAIFGVKNKTIPFLAALSLGKSIDVLKCIVEHHDIEDSDFSGLAFNVNGVASIAGGTIGFDLNDIHNSYFKAISLDTDLWPKAWRSVQDRNRSIEADAGLMFFNSPDAWINNRAMDASPAELKELSNKISSIPEWADASNIKNWPNQNFNTYLERSGGYLEHILLNHTKDLKREEPSYWYNLLCEKPRHYKAPEQSRYYRTIFESVDVDDGKFLRGVRSIYASRGGSQHLMYILSAMLSASDNVPAIGSVIGSELMLMRASWDPENFDIFNLDLSKVHPKLVDILANDQKDFVSRICKQLLDIPVHEFNKFDLMAVHNANLMMPGQSLSGVDGKRLIDHLLRAFSANEHGYTNVNELLEAQLTTIRWVAQQTDLSAEFLDKQSDRSLELMALAGLDTRQRLTEQALGRVFGQELGL